MIEVRALDGETFEVTVSGRTLTTHRVTVRPAYHQQLTGGRVDAETLVRRSIEFLLEREPNTSILSRFDLSMIARYFPEYERVIRSTA
jgi:hypothetical protein